MSRINVSLLKNYKSDFNNEKSKFNSNAYSTFDSGYIKRCSDGYVIRMRNNLQTLYDKVQKGYNNIDSWWTDYNNDIENLENVLSENSSSGSIKQSSIRNYVNANLHKLNNYNVGFADVISLNFVSNTPNLTFESSYIDSVGSTNSVSSTTNKNSNPPTSWWEENVVSWWNDTIVPWWEDVKATGANCLNTIEELGFLGCLAMAGNSMNAQNMSNAWAFSSDQLQTYQDTIEFNNAAVMSSGEKFKEIEEKLAATGATVVTGLGEGLAKAGEWFLDGMAMLGNSMSAQNMNNAWAFTPDQMQIYQDTIKWNNEATKAFVEKDYVT